MGASRASVCELMKGGEGKEGEERGTGRRGCRVGPAVGVRVPHRARGGMRAWLAAIRHRIRRVSLRFACEPGVVFLLYRKLGQKLLLQRCSKCMNEIAIYN